MRDFNAIPRVDISHTPTPIEFAPRLSTSLNCNLFFKRDDCTGLAGGGNKTRKLEYLIADALAKGADTLVTLGGLQSNHARQTAAAAAKFGLHCELVLEDVVGTPKADYYLNGNILLDNILGAKIHRLAANADLASYAKILMSQLRQQGYKPYLVPIGGSDVIGSLGYVKCAMEIVQQIEQQSLTIDQIVIATGSAGTQAGLLAGLIAAKSQIPVLGICVSKSNEQQKALVTNLLIDLLAYLELSPKFEQGIIQTNDEYFGEGYGISTPSMIDAVKRCASLEGILIDPVYTGKAMAGLIDLIETNAIAAQSNQLFIHTGGSQGLFAYQTLFNKL